MKLRASIAALSTAAALGLTGAFLLPGTAQASTGRQRVASSALQRGRPIT